MDKKHKQRRYDIRILRKNRDFNARQLNQAGAMLEGGHVGNLGQDRKHETSIVPHLTNLTSMKMTLHPEPNVNVGFCNKSPELEPN